MKKKISLLFLSITVMLITLNQTIAYYNTSSNFNNVFRAESYKISIDATGGTFGNDKVVLNGVSAVLPTPYRKGYDFLGFANTPDGDVKYSTNISNVESINDRKIYSKWQIITYSISYDLAGGGITGQPKTYNVEENVTLPNPTRRGYNFLGWTGTDLSSPTKNVTIPKGSIGNRSYKANWELITYSISYNLNGGSISNQPTSYNVTSTYTLPTPSRKGYTFTGWSGTDISGTKMSVTVSDSIGDKVYTANWSQNYYTVNYYVNGGLWTTRSVGYGNNVENLNAQSLLDGYHTFHGWNGWVDTMPDYDITLTASITEAYCALITGHGVYGNAAALLGVFQSAGWTGRVEEAPSAPGYYWVVTDYTLTRAEAEYQKQYIARNTNYTNYNHPYLYWVSIQCTNGYSQAWTRPKGQSYFD